MQIHTVGVLTSDTSQEVGTIFGGAEGSPVVVKEKSNVETTACHDK